MWMNRIAGAFFVFSFFFAFSLSAQVDLYGELNPQESWEIRHNKDNKVKASTTFAKYTISPEYRNAVYTYNSLGRVISEKRYNAKGELLEERTYAYDKKGRMTLLQTPQMELRLTYSRKGLKEIKGTCEGKPAEWDAASRVLTLSDKSGKKTAYTFDGPGRVVKQDEIAPAGSDNYDDLLIAYEYTGDGEIALIRRQELGEESDHSDTKRKFIYENNNLIRIEHNMENDYTMYEETSEYKYNDGRLVEIRIKNEADFAKYIYLYDERQLLKNRQYYFITQEGNGDEVNELHETLRYEYTCD